VCYSTNGPSSISLIRILKYSLHEKDDQEGEEEPNPNPNLTLTRDNALPILIIEISTEQTSFLYVPTIGADIRTPSYPQSNSRLG
jgi:hypothetical protein